MTFDFYSRTLCQPSYEIKSVEIGDVSEPNLIVTSIFGYLVTASLGFDSHPVKLLFSLQDVESGDMPSE